MTPQRSNLSYANRTGPVVELSPGDDVQVTLSLLPADAAYLTSAIDDGQYTS